MSDDEFLGLPERVRHRLRAAREYRGWSLVTAAAELGCSDSFLGRIERGLRLPGEDVSGRLVLVYDLPEPIEAALWAGVDALDDPAGYDGQDVSPEPVPVAAPVPVTPWIEPDPPDPMEQRIAELVAEDEDAVWL